MTKVNISAILIPVYIISILLIVGCASTSRPVYVGRTISIPLKSSPEGASVLVDGQQKGYTPMTLKFTYLIGPNGNDSDETGERIVKIEKEGYEPYVLSFSTKGKEFETMPGLILIKMPDHVIKAEDSVIKDQEKIREEIEIKKKFKETLKEVEKLRKEISLLKEEKNARDIKQKTMEDSSAKDWFEKGLAFGNAKSYKEEIEAYKQAIRIKPDYVEAHYNLVLSYLMLKDRDFALEEYKVLKDLAPEKANDLYEKSIVRTSLDKDNVQAGTYNNNGKENKLIETSKTDNQYASQTIYTIQTGSFIEIAPALKQYSLIVQGLNKKEIEYLRIEQVGKFYTVRFGKFENYAIAEKFLDLIKPHISGAVILKAYIKENRIIKLYNVN